MTACLEDVSSRLWDVVVVGAGPAGALTAREAARLGCSVLLVDKARFPRHKVCGCCLNRRSLSALASVGLGALPANEGAVTLTAFHVAARARRAFLSLPDGAALSRAALDAALVREAVASGAHFLSGTMASSAGFTESARRVDLWHRERSCNVETRVLVVADGLGSRFLKQESGLVPAQRRDARVGAGVIADNAPDAYESGIIYMACGKHGYVGMVRLEDGRLDVAAAFDPRFVKDVGGLGAAAAHVLDESGMTALQGLERLPWKGTPLLTQAPRRVAAHRVFLVGDATGYVEPFTGEGMAWALDGAVCVAPLVARAARGWAPRLAEEWTETHRGAARQRQRVCRLAAAALRYPALVRMAIAAVSAFPELAAPIVNRLNEPIERKGPAFS